MNHLYIIEVPKFDAEGNQSWTEQTISLYWLEQPWALMSFADLGLEPLIRPLKGNEHRKILDVHHGNDIYLPGVYHYSSPELGAFLHMDDFMWMINKVMRAKIIEHLEVEP